MTTPGTEYTCARCGGTFERTRSDEEAMAEAQQRWPGAVLALVCDDCFQTMMERAAS